MTKNYGLICVVLTGNNPMVGATVACAVSVDESQGPYNSSAMQLTSIMQKYKILSPPNCSGGDYLF